jgi:hypothetical protein
MTSDSPPDSGRPPKSVVRRWQLIIIAVSFVLPVYDLIDVQITKFPNRSLGAAFLAVLLWCSAFAVVWNWPFFVLAARVKRTFVKHWPNVQAAHVAVIGGLIGLSIPYVFLYAVVSDELAAHDGRGPGVSLIGPLVCWAVGGLLAYCGLRIGARVPR